ncbi:23S rRNA (adenine(2030)-N(6))-methyltransferase RlmJ [uncultured Aureimonas sp.]|uniref:23S rRNA (adenine(2030)-N(6))-methyltransferase RlmJ n=1 Tax=uncultured Aureimonas sp. TaxID=1604662 RepID=UPI0025D336D4|nr:23S rRNA (adenine(2030)-N(6))-methyltransferase RlmJ [uncultured Aureimonas sp.]
MNYRHAFHAGNFADVVKHALLCRLIEYLKRKDKPFRVMDTHAGRGRYDLDADEAQRTGEAEAGIEAVRRSEAWNDALLAPYREAVEAAGAELGPQSYPGSPWIARHLLRRQDRLSAYELHPVDAKALAETFAGDVQVKTIELDGWLALGAHLPPKEKRGLVLIDPPFEEVGEFERIVARVGDAWRRWPGGTYAIWYPIKRRAQYEAFHAALHESGMRNIVVADFFREPFSADERLVGTGFAVVNPPFTFAAEACDILEALVPVLGVADRGNCGIIALVAE